MEDKKRYLVTSALPYANGPLHLGHLAGAYLPADIYVRYQRANGEDVVYVCGSDEHGAAITIKAIKENTTPKAIIDHYHAVIKKSFEDLGVSFDIYHRTSEKIHHETSQDFFRDLYNAGAFEKKTAKQYYDLEAKQFLADRYIKGTCPKCGNEDAYGDQCEKCGSSLSPTDLINPYSTISGGKLELRDTTHFYLSLDKHTEWLEKWITDGTLDGVQHHDPKAWKNHVIGQCKSWLGDLQPRAMTRDLDWGVDVPQDIEGSEGKKLYVWLDAPIGYISATKQWAQDNNKDWKTYWQDKDTKLVHFIGKDNIVFHCITFPAILKAHGDYILPTNVPANQFMNLEGKKLSTSRGWAVWADEYLVDFQDIPHHADVLRYYMIKNMPEQKDADFTWQGFQDAANNELVNTLANFTNRVIVLTNKYYDGAIPAYDASLALKIEEQKDGTAKDVIAHTQTLIDELADLIQRYEFRQALKKIMELAAYGNAILTHNEPWKKIKEDEEQVKVVMNLALQITAALSVAMEPFMPFASNTLKEQLAATNLQTATAWKDMLATLANGEALLPSGHVIGKPAHLFSRIPDEMIKAQVEKLEAAAEALKETEYPPVQENCTFDDFTKVDLRVGTIIKAEKMKKAKKLLVLEVDLGFETRTVVSGIAEYFSPEEVLNQQVVVVANLAPRKLRGVESQGMILMAEDASGKLEFVSPANASPNGFGVR